MITEPIKVRVRPSAFNEKIFKEVMPAKERVMFVVGGKGAGKSVGVAQCLIIRLLQYPKRRLLCMRETYRSHRHSTFEELVDIIRRYNMNHLFDVPTGKSTLDIKCINGNDIVFAGCDDPERLKSIRGVTDIWFEEVSETTHRKFTQSNLLMRGKIEAGPGYQIIGSFNPEPQALWVRDKFEGKENVKFVHMTHIDNKWLDDEYRVELENLKDINPELYKIYTLGQWGELLGLIYPEIEVVDSLPSGGTRIFGVDFGYEHPSVIVEIRLTEKKAYIKTRLYQKHLTNEDLIKFIQENFDRKEQQDLWFADTAEPARIESIYRAGINIYPADKDVTAGIDCVKSFKLHITGDSPETLREMRSYCRQQDKEGNILDTPVKMYDHSPDAVRYALYTYYRKYGMQSSDFSFVSVGRRVFA